jgi:hypothetical protein
MNINATVQKLLLPALILVTPFLVFLNYNSYCLSCAETSIALSGLLGLALICAVIMLIGGKLVSGLVMAVLITAFIDLQFTPANLPDWADEWTAVLFFAGMQIVVLSSFLKEKFYGIATAVFSTFFIVTVFQLAVAGRNNDSRFEQHKPSVHAPPRIIHLVLDEHIGIEGIPTDIEGGSATKELITQFYLKNNFHLFGGAFSHYFNTHFSVPNMLNFSALNKHNAYLYPHDRNAFTLLQNEYFNLLSEKNYNMAVLSSGFLNLCANQVVDRCSYQVGTLRSFAKLNIPTSQKFQVLISRYLNQSSVVSFLVRTIVLNFHSQLPWAWAFELERTRLDSLNALMNLRSLWNNILSLPHGTALFAHLMIPHAPYIAYPDCSIRPPNQDSLWNDRNSQSKWTNTITSRQKRYQLYFQQLECLYLKLDELFEGMRAAGIYDDSIIILHGDHGSRLVLIEPVSKNQHALSKQDLVDGFSTLFAMKMPGKSGGYDASPWPLEQLFAKFAFEAGLSPRKILSEKTEPFVYLTAGPDEEFIRVPYTPPN